MKKYLILAFISLILVTPSVAQALGEQVPFRVQSVKLLRAGKTTVLSVVTDPDRTIAFSCAWRADKGRIEGKGNQVHYTAPDEAGKVLITLTATDKNGAVFRESVPILIYKQLIMIKADDLAFEENTAAHQELNQRVEARWEAFFHYVTEQHIKVAAGLVTVTLETANREQLALIKRICASELFEVWLHGYWLDYVDQNKKRYYEFYNTPYDYQRFALLKSRFLAREKLNLVFHTFSPSGNKFDDNTVKALSSMDEIKVWLFGDPRAGKMVLKRETDAEFPAFHPDFKKFLNNYHPDADYLVLQVHPHGWNADRFNEFKKIVAFLKDRGATFITPFDYYKLKAAP